MRILDDNTSSESKPAVAKKSTTLTPRGKPAKKAAGKTASKRTSQIDIVAALEHDIVSGSIKPNQRLDERELAQRFQVSRTPVREALNRLVSSGIVEYRPRQGMFAAAMTMSQFFHMYEVMAHLEALCAHLCARRMSRADQQALTDLHAGVDAILEAQDVAAYNRYNQKFHDLLYRGAKNPVLEEQVRALTEIWTGDSDPEQAIQSGDLNVQGAGRNGQRLWRWLGRSMFANTRMAQR